MRFHGLGPALFGSPARAAVLSTMLQSVGEELTGREVARRAGVSPPRALEALRVFEAERLCHQRRVGRASLWAVDPRHFLAKHLGPFAQLESAPRGELLALLRRHVGDAEEAYLFGSVAERREDASSDIDVLLVFPDERAKRRWQRGLNDLQDAVLALFGNHLQPIAYTRLAVSRGAPRRLLEAAKAKGVPLAGSS